MVKIVNLHEHVNISHRNKNKLKDGNDKNVNGRHYSVGAVIKKGKKYLMIDRKLFPPGYAGIAGHMQKDESPEKALKRELKEETNYDLISRKLLFHEIINGNECRAGFNTHEWYLFECKCKGKLRIAKKEEKSIGYISKEKIKLLHKNKKLEPVWEYWFKKLKII